MVKVGFPVCGVFSGSSRPHSDLPYPREGAQGPQGGGGPWPPPHLWPHPGSGGVRGRGAAAAVAPGDKEGSSCSWSGEAKHAPLIGMLVLPPGSARSGSVGKSIGSARDLQIFLPLQGRELLSDEGTSVASEGLDPRGRPEAPVRVTLGQPFWDPGSCLRSRRF